MSRTNNPDNPNCKPEDSEPNRDVNALFSSFRLDQPSYRTFTRHRSPKVPSEHLELVSERAELANAEPVRQDRIHVGIFSPMGGAGKSMLAASLGGVLWQLGKRVLLVDTSPWSSLAFHYGATNARSGLRSFFAPENKELPIRILAWDKWDAAAPSINAYAAVSPLDCVIFDLSGVSGKELPTYLQQCEILLVPLLPDSSAPRMTEAVETFLGSLQESPKRVIYVINQMEDTPLAKEVYATLSLSLGDRLFPKLIYRQPEIPEALAEGVVLPFFAPKAQAVIVCNEIARSLQSQKAATLHKTQQRWSER